MKDLYLYDITNEKTEVNMQNSKFILDEINIWKI